MTTTNAPLLTIGVLESGIEFTVEGEAAIAALPTDESEIFELFRSITVRRIATAPTSFDQVPVQEIGTIMTANMSAADERFIETLLEIFADQEAFASIRESIEADSRARHRERMAECRRHRQLKRFQGLAA